MNDAIHVEIKIVKIRDLNGGKQIHHYWKLATSDKAIWNVVGTNNLRCDRQPAHLGTDT
jgi:hypothetical protein